MNRHFFDQILAKSDGFTTLEIHTRHVLKASESLLESLSFSADEKLFWKEKMKRCIVLHDLGKLHVEFQKRMRREPAIPVRHELISLWFCSQFLELPIDELFAIATHHKGVISNKPDSTRGRLFLNQLTSHITDWYNRDKNNLARETFIQWNEMFCIPISIKDGVPESSLPKSILPLFFSGRQLDFINNLEVSKQLSLTRSFLIAADHIGSARKENDIPTYKKIELADFQPKKGGVTFPFRSFQEALQHVTSDIILHAPTGSGKTEAALNWVYGNQSENARLFYLLPYTASINAMFFRLQKVFGEERVTVLHSKSLDFFYEQISEEDSNLNPEAIVQEAKNRKSLSKEIFYPVKVATLYQILKTSLKGKGWEFALFDYKNALFIVDEFHTYDALLTGMLLSSIKLFRNIFNAKFLFLSATIPDFLLQRIIDSVFNGDRSKLIRPNPQKESDRQILSKKRHQLYCKAGQTILNELELVGNYLNKGRSVLIIVNNVKTAQRLYKGIKFDGTIQLLHSGFNKQDRNAIEKTIVHNSTSKKPQLLIATQAVEVSLDIDYDIAFIENAPIDALIQRLGRINRAGEKKIYPNDSDIQINYLTVPVYIFENIIGKTPFYNKDVLQLTWDELQKQNGKELSEDDLITMCNNVYVNGYNNEQERDFTNGLNNVIITNFEKDWIAGDWHSWTDELLKEKNQKIEVLCFNLLEEFKQKVREKRFLEANQLLVQVYNYEPKLSREKLYGDTLVAINLKYDPVIGYFSIEKDIDEGIL